MATLLLQIVATVVAAFAAASVECPFRSGGMTAGSYRMLSAACLFILLLAIWRVW